MGHQQQERVKSLLDQSIQLIQIVSILIIQELSNKRNLVPASKVLRDVK